MNDCVDFWLVAAILGFILGLLAYHGIRRADGDLTPVKCAARRQKRLLSKRAANYIDMGFSEDHAMYRAETELRTEADDLYRVMNEP